MSLKRDKYFKGKVVLITGAASGLGRAIAEELTRSPVEALILADIDVSRLSGFCAAHPILKAEGVDVTDKSMVDAMFERILKQFGRIDILFNIVGKGITGDFSRITAEHWDDIIRINLKSTVYCSLAAYKMMLQQGEGQVVNMSSCAGLVPAPGVPYTTTKSALLGFSHSLRIEAAGKGIRVNAVCPFFVETSYFKNRIQTGDVDNHSISFGNGRKKMQAGECARRILKGVMADKPTIKPGFTVKSLDLFYRLMPRMFFRFWRKIYSLPAPSDRERK